MKVISSKPGSNLERNGYFVNIFSECRYFRADIDFFFLIFKLHLSNSVEDASYDRDRSKILSSFKCDKIFMDSVDILWFIGKNLGWGKEGPTWYFEAHECSRYWIGLR